MTGIHYSDRVQSGLSNRPQIAFSRQADRLLAMSNLIAGLLQEAGSAKLVDLFLWSDMAGLVDARFRQRPYRGVVMLDLSRGPDARFRKFSQTRRNNITRAIKCGVTVDLAKSRNDVSAYYAVYVDWARRVGSQISPEEHLQEEFFATRRNRQLFLARYKSEVIAGVMLRFFPGGAVEHAANSSLQSALHLRPNDLLHWRPIEWAYAEGLTKYGLGGTSLFLRKVGGEVVPTTRHRLDRSLLPDTQSAIGWPTGSRRSAHLSRSRCSASLARCGAMSKSSATKAIDARCKSGALLLSRRCFKTSRAETPSIVRQVTAC
jgi:Acetyltransferase (GNAT) domain